MSRSNQPITIAIGFAIAILTISSALSIALLTLEPFGAAVSGLFSRMTGIPTIYADRDAKRELFAASKAERLLLSFRLAEAQAKQQECTNLKADLKTQVRDHLTLNEQRALQLAIATRTARQIHMGIRLGLSRHLQSAPLKAVPAIGTGVVMALTVAELSQMCAQHDQVNELLLSIDADHERFERPTVCTLGPEALSDLVHHRIFRESKRFNWQEECLQAEIQATASLDCDRFPAQGPIDPDSWIDATRTIEFLAPVDPDDSIRRGPKRHDLLPVDPN